MEYLIIALASLVASLLTFFSGFGLGTLLMPVFALLFPVEQAVALTGVVHLLNNVFKMGLIGRHVNWQVALRFGLPAAAAAFLGAWLLLQLSNLPVLASYSLSGREHQITLIKVVIAVLMIVFALFELLPSLKKIQFGADKLFLGGLLSGFFGGLSGHQGALRTAFLLRLGLTKEAFIASGIAIALMIDITRIGVYSYRFAASRLYENWPILLTAILAAFAGAYLGRQFLKSATLNFVQTLAALLILLVALLLATGTI